MNCPRCEKWAILHIVDEPTGRRYCVFCGGFIAADFDGAFLRLAQVRPLSDLSERPARDYLRDGRQNEN